MELLNVCFLFYGGGHTERTSQDGSFKTHSSIHKQIAREPYDEQKLEIICPPS